MAVELNRGEGPRCEFVGVHIHGHQPMETPSQHISVHLSHPLPFISSSLQLLCTQERIVEKTASPVRVFQVTGTVQILAEPHLPEQDVTDPMSINPDFG